MYTSKPFLAAPPSSLKVSRWFPLPCLVCIVLNSEGSEQFVQCLVYPTAVFVSSLAIVACVFRHNCTDLSPAGCADRDDSCPQRCYSDCGMFLLVCALITVSELKQLKLPHDTY